MVLIYLPLSPPIRLLQVVGLGPEIGVRDPCLCGLRLLAPQVRRGIFLTVVLVSGVGVFFDQALHEVLDELLVRAYRYQVGRLYARPAIQGQEASHHRDLLGGSSGICFSSPTYIREQSILICLILEKFLSKHLQRRPPPRIPRRPPRQKDLPLLGSEPANGGCDGCGGRSRADTASARGC